MEIIANQRHNYRNVEVRGPLSNKTTDLVLIMAGDLVFI